MKVLFINSVVDYGSTGKIVRDLAMGLKDNGHDVKMVFGRYQPKDTTDTVDISDKFGTYWHVLMTRLFGRHGMHSTRATKKLIQFIHEYDPDVIHMHNLHGYYLNVPLLLKSLQNSQAKLMITLHDCWTFSGSSAYFDYHGCRVWDNGCVECNSTRDYPEVMGFVNQKRNYRWKEHGFTSLSGMTVITPSEWLTECAKNTFLSKHDVKTIYNGIDLSVFKPAENTHISNISDTDRVYLGVSSIWERRKGLDVFHEFAHKLEDHEKLILVGLSEQQIAELPEHVIGITRTSSMDELVQYYTRADVFLNPTLEDNFPTTNLESLACGTPVVTFNTGGSPEAIDSKTGVVTEKKSADSLYMGIKQIETLDDVKSQCIKRANDYFSKELMVKLYLQEILGKGGMQDVTSD